MFCSHLSFINLSLSLTPPSLSVSPSLSFLLSRNFSPKSQPLIDQPCSSSNYLPSAASLSLLTSQSLSNLLLFSLPLWLCSSLSGEEGHFLPLLSLSPHLLSLSWFLSWSLFAPCLLVSVEKKYSVFSSLSLSLCQSRRAASSQMLLSSPLLRCMCWLSSLPLPPSLCWSLALWPAEWFAPQLPAVTICPFNAWSADACSLLPPSPSPSLPPSLCLSSCCLSSRFNHLLLSLLLSFSQAKGDKLHLLVSRKHTEREKQQEVFFNSTHVVCEKLCFSVKHMIRYSTNTSMELVVIKCLSKAKCASLNPGKNITKQ